MPILFKDLFSEGASDYALYRPTYPEDLFTYLAEICRKRDRAWDCATGNGQAALALTPYFEKVWASDPSQKQIARAPHHPKIEYHVATAECCDLATNSVDLVTVAQALHWFDQPSFFREAQRVLNPDGVLAFWCYELAVITPEVDRVVQRLYSTILGSYWEPNRKLVEEGYRSVRVPFAAIAPPEFAMKAEWTLAHLVGYLNTWSAVQTYLKKENSNPLELVFSDLQSAWGSVERREVQWPLSVRVFRV